MAKLINVPSSYGSPYVDVYLNGARQRIYTGKEVSVGDAIYEIMMRAMDKEVAPESPVAENFRIFFKLDGDKVVCNRKYEEVIDMAKNGANIIAAFNQYGDTYIMNSTFIGKTSDKITFSCPVASSEGLKCLVIHFYSDESCVKTLSLYGG